MFAYTCIGSNGAALAYVLKMFQHAYCSQNNILLYILTVFLTATWLCHDQPLATVEGAVSKLYINHCVLILDLTQGHWEPHNKVGSKSPARYLVGFEPR